VVAGILDELKEFLEKNYVQSKSISKILLCINSIGCIMSLLARCRFTTYKDEIKSLNSS